MVNDQDSALADLQKAIELDPSNSLAYGSQGQILQRQAEKKVVSLASAPDVNALKLEINALVEKSIECFQIQASLSNNAVPQLIRANIGLGNSYIVVNKYQEAVDALNEALKLDANNVVTLATRATAFSAMGQYQSAIQDYERALSQKSSLDKDMLVKLHRNRAIDFASLGDIERAIESASVALELDSADPVSYQVRAGLYEQKGEFDLALRDSTEFVQLSDSHIAYLQRGHLYSKCNKVSQGYQDWKRALELNEQYCLEMMPDLYSKFALFLSAAMVDNPSEMKETLEFCNRAIEKDPKSAATFAARAAVYTKYLNFEKVVEDYTNALQLQASPDYYVGRAAAYAALTQYANALQDVERALAIQPDHAHANQLKTTLPLLISKTE